MIRKEIKDIVKNIGKFEKGMNGNQDLFLTGFGLRLIISFWSKGGIAEITYDLGKESIKGLFNKNIYLTQDERRYLYDELGVKELLNMRSEILIEQSTKILQSISFED